MDLHKNRRKDRHKDTGHKDRGTQRHGDTKTQGHKDTGGTQRHRRDTKTQEGEITHRHFGRIKT